MSPYCIVYRKAYQPPVKIARHITVNLDLNLGSPLIKLLINELEELRCDAYKNICIFKER